MFPDICAAAQRFIVIKAEDTNNSKRKDVLLMFAVYLIIRDH